jgi:hypothetical protein
MRFFSRRTRVRPERELTAAERLALPPWRAELARLGLGGVDPVFAANDDGASVFVSDRRFAITPELGVIVVTPQRLAFLHRLGDGVGSVVAEPREIGGLAGRDGSLELLVGDGAWQLAGDPSEWCTRFELVGISLAES